LSERAFAKCPCVSITLVPPAIPPCHLVSPSKEKG
jgi:hypothetical protein